MRKDMLLLIITSLLNQFVANLDVDDLRDFLDGVIDAIESTVEKSENKLDDSMLPGLRLVRELFGIQDSESGGSATGAR